MGSAITTVGLIIVGLIRASKEQSLGFTQSVVARVNAVEKHANEREQLCEQRLEQMHRMFSAQLDALRGENRALADKVNQLERRRSENTPDTRL